MRKATRYMAEIQAQQARLAAEQKEMDIATLERLLQEARERAASEAETVVKIGVMITVAIIVAIVSWFVSKAKK